MQSKRFIKFCEKFEGFWFGFDLKKNCIEKGLEKKKRKKRNNLTFRSDRPIGLAARAHPRLFLSRALASGPGRQAVSFLSLAPSLSSAAAGHLHFLRSRLCPFSPFLLQPAIKSRNYRAHNSLQVTLCFPFYLPHFCPEMPAAIIGKAPPLEFSFFPLKTFRRYINLIASSLPFLCPPRTCIQPPELETAAPPPLFFRRRRAIVAAGER
jgi:hypothetical protein